MKINLLPLYILFLLIPFISFSQAPIINSFNPTSAPVGTNVTLSGNNFSFTLASNIVFFGAVKATVISATSTQLVVQVPSGATAKPISLTVNALTCYTKTQFLPGFLPGGPYVSTAFNAPANFSVSTYPNKVILKDIDGDGKADIVVSNSLTGPGMTILRNKNTTPGTIDVNSFAARVDFGGITSSNAFAVEDFNGDGKPDVIASNYSLSNLTFLLNTSTSNSISFNSNVVIPTTEAAVNLAVADLNGDGKLDVVMASNTKKVYFLMNTSEGNSISFTNALSFDGGNNISSLACTDLDGDGKLDLIVGSTSTKNGGGIFTTYLNTSNLTNISLGTKTEFTGGQNSPFALGDLDNDGQIDLVTCSYEGSYSVFRNTSTPGSIAFAGGLSFPAQNIGSVILGEIDGDGKLDVIVNGTTVGKNTSTTGNISFEPQAAFNLGGAAIVDVGDVDSDGKPDLITKNYESGIIGVFRNKINEPAITTFSPQIGLAGTIIEITGTNLLNTSSVTIGNTPVASYTVNSSTSITAVVGTGATGNVVAKTALGTGTGTLFYFSAPPPVITSFSPLKAPINAKITIKGKNFNPVAANNIVFFGAARAQVNSATETELEVTVPIGANYQPITVASNGLSAVSDASFNVIFADSGPIGPTTFGKTFDMRTLSYPSEIVAADLDLDGKIDLIVRSGATFSFFKNSSSVGNTAFAARQDFVQSKTINHIVVKDIDADGKPDILFTTATSFVILKNTSSAGNLSFAAPITINADSTPSGLVAADFDNDGKLDIAIAHSGAKKISFFFNTSTGNTISFGAAVSMAAAYGSIQFALDNIYARDLDHDGRVDLITINTISSNQFVAVYKNTSTIGNLSFLPVALLEAGHSQNSLLEDMDQDGLTDVIQANSIGFAISKNNGTTGQISFNGTATGSISTTPSGIDVGDIDGDGKPDLAVSGIAMPGYIYVFKNNSSNGTITLALSGKYLKTNTTSTTGAIGTWDSSAIICDFDGDGKPDICGSNGQGATISISTNLINGPAILSFAPVEAGTDNTVKITGANFTGVTDVKFGGVSAASFTIDSPTSITAIIGSGLSGEVTVVNPISIGALSGFKFLPTATITSFTPMAASYGENVVINGTNFTGASQVTFGGVKAKSFYIESATKITAVVDQPSTSGLVGVTVPAGTVSAAGFVYAPVPLITAFNPSIGDVGATVDIEGKNFSAATTDNVIYFGATQATVNTASITKLSVTVPLGAGYQPISVYTKNSALGSHSAKAFNTTFASKNAVSSSDFAGKLDFPTSNNPQGMVSKDIDGDGKTDFIVVNGTSNTVSIYRNTATSGSVTLNSYAAKISFQTGKGAQHVAVGDLDGDGKPDMAVVNYTDNTISVYRNLSSIGNISFATAVDYPTGLGPYALSIADIDKDGKAEVVTANFIGNSISIFQNQSTSGNMIFKPKFDLATATGPKSVAVGDTDGDGKPEIITANFTSNNISVYKNVSVGGIINTTSFETRYDISTSTGSNAVFLADLNQDAKLEAIVANATNNSISILSNVSAYSSTKIQLSTGNEPRSLIVGDVDGDGQPDIVVANAGSNTVSIFRNTMPLGSVPSVSFAAKVDLQTGVTPSYLNLADVDGDGKIDIITSNAGNTFSVLRNNPGTPTPVVQPPAILSVLPDKGKIGVNVIIKGLNFNVTPASNIVYFGATRAQVISATATELNVIIPASASYHQVTVLDLQTKLMGYSNLPYLTTFTSKNEITANDLDAKVDFITGNSPSAIASGDLDGDGKPDLVVSNFAANTISVYRNTSTPGNINASAYGAKVDFAVGAGPQLIKLVDLDGDGKLDIVVVNKTANSISLLQNLSTTGSLSSNSFAAKVDIASIYAQSMAIGDVDGDGKPEILALNYTYISILLNKVATSGFTTTSFAPKVDFPISSGTSSSVVLSDMNNDGKQDIVLSFNGGFDILINNSKPSFLILNNKVQISVSASTENNIMAISDVDDDGKLDVLIGSDRIYLLRNKMTGNVLNKDSFEEKVSFAGDKTDDPYIYSMSIADMDGDGKPDIVYSANGLNQVSIFRNISTNATPAYTFFDAKVNYAAGNKTAGNIVVDVDGDGKGDVIFVNQGSNTISILPNNPKAKASINPPVITSMSPSFGPAGTEVTLTGNNFNAIPANNLVSFGGISATVNSANSTMLTVKIPVGAAYSKATVLNKDNNLSAYTTKKFGVSFTSKKDITKKDFDPPVNFSPFQLVNAKSADFDGDGKPDLVNLSINSTIFVMRNVSTPGTINANSFVSNYYSVAVGKDPQDLKIADVDGDGKPDVLVTYYSFYGIGISVLLNNSTPGNVAFAKAVNINYDSVPYGDNSFRVEVGDADGDGKPELLISNSTLKGISIFKNDCKPGVVVFNKQYNFEAGRGSSSVNLVDMDNDGKPDLIITNKEDNTLSILKNISPLGTLNSASFANHIDFPTIVSPIRLAIGDLNGDGKPDIVVAAATGLSVFENTCVNGIISQSSLAAKVDVKGNANSVEIADMDGDNYPDIIIVGGLSPTMIRNVSGSGAISKTFFADNAVTLSTDKSYKTLDIVDVDGDGKADIVASDGISAAVFRNHPQPADAPQLNSFTPAAAGRDAEVTIIGTNFVDVTEIIFGGIKAKSFTVVNPTKITAIVGAGQSGEVSVKTQTGMAALAGFTYLPTPTITAIGPNGAFTGSKITITGTGFTGATSVSFGGINAAAFSVISSTEISAILANGATGDIVVIAPGGTASFAGFNYYGQPAIGSISPDIAGSGGTVTITGTNFTGTTLVTLGGVNASSFTVISSTTITVKVGGGASGNVEVTTPGGTATFAGFNYTYLLSTDNFKVATNSVSCKGSKNGAIKITAVSNLNYVATIVSNGKSTVYDFTTSLNVNNLEAGNYNVCFTLPSQPTFKQCLDVVVTEPKELGLYTNVNAVNPTVTLMLSGANVYYININGVNYQTTKNELTLPLSSGVNALTLSSDITCQGTIKKTLLLYPKISFSPNPVDKILKIGMGDDQSSTATIEIYNLAGQRLYQARKLNEGFIEIDMDNLPTGMYVIKVSTETRTVTSKILKK